MALMFCSLQTTKMKNNKDSEIAHLPENLIYQSQLIMPLALWLDSILPPMQQQCGDPLNHRLEID